MTSSEQIAELQLHRRARQMMEELESAGGSHVRATVVRGGGAVLAAAPKSPNDRGFYSVQACLVGGVEVTVYVPDRVSLTDGAPIEVVEGRYGYYFRSVVSPE